MIAAFKGAVPKLGPEVFIAENAAVIGDVSLGKSCSVWFSAVVRGDNAPITIGDGSNIQDNVTVHCDPGHPLRIGSNVTVGHNAVVHCREVGDNSLIGMGACLLDGAVIGRDCVIAAGAVVRENAIVPDGTLMAGVPAKAVRSLTPEQRAKLQDSSHYTALAREYLE